MSGVLWPKDVTVATTDNGTSIMRFSAQVGKQQLLDQFGSSLLFTYCAVYQKCYEIYACGTG